MEQVQSVLCSGNVNIKQWQILDRVGDRTATSRSLHSSCPGRTIFLSSVPLLPSCLYSLFFLIGAPQQPCTGARCCLTPQRHPLPFSFYFIERKKT